MAMTCVVMAYIVMASIVMAYIFMAFVVIGGRKVSSHCPQCMAYIQGMQSGCEH